MAEQKRVNHYKVPKLCEQCGSDDVLVKVHFDTGIVMYLCRECNWSRCLRKEEIIASRRGATNQANGWRFRVLHESFNRCAICGSTENLHAHHIIPISHSQEHEFDPRNGIALCERCHHLVHYKDGKYDPN